MTSLIVLLWITASPPSFEAPTVDYSAKAVIQLDTNSMNGMLYFGQGPVRFDYRQNDQDFSLVYSQAKKSAWLRIPAQKMQFKIPISQSELNTAFAPIGTWLEIKPIGKTTIHSVPVQQYQVRFREKSGAIYGGTMCVSSQRIIVQIRLSLETHHQKAKKIPKHFKLELSQLKVHPVSKKLFVISEGYKTLDLESLLSAVGPKPFK